MSRYLKQAQEAIDRCKLLAQYTEQPGRTTRTFLSPPMRDVHDNLRQWMQSFGMREHIDDAGNQRGIIGKGPRWIIASHLDTVPNAGAYDGILGVVLGLTLAQLASQHPLPFELEVIGFSEEEGVRFGVPFIGSRALIGDAAPLLDLRDNNGVTVRDCLREYGLDPSRIAQATTQASGYLEIHIEQGPVLESLDLPLGIVHTIAGQSRLDLTFTGQANHAGTTPMPLRRDALAAAAQWICLVEEAALHTPGLVATVGHITATPNVRNAINGQVLASLDVRHADDSTRHSTVDTLLKHAEAIATTRNLTLQTQLKLDQPAVPMDPALTARLETAVSTSGHRVHRMTSGAGHDAMIVASHIPSAMLFLRSPGGISHHPDENVLLHDVAAALEAGMQFLNALEAPNV
jgi:allantoate deiminase